MTLWSVSARSIRGVTFIPVESYEAYYNGWEPLTRLDQLNRCQMKPHIVVVRCLAGIGEGNQAGREI